MATHEYLSFSCQRDRKGFLRDLIGSIRFDMERVSEVLDLFRLMIQDPSPDRDDICTYALLHSCANDFHEGVVFLVSNNVGVNSSHFMSNPERSASWSTTCLHKCRNLVTLDLLIEKGASLKAKDGCGRTPLNAVIQEGGDMKVVQLLLQNGSLIDNYSLEWIVARGYPIELIQQALSYPFDDFFGSQGLGNPMLWGLMSLKKPAFTFHRPELQLKLDLQGHVSLKIALEISDHIEDELNLYRTEVFRLAISRGEEPDPHYCWRFIQRILALSPGQMTIDEDSSTLDILFTVLTACPSNRCVFPSIRIETNPTLTLVVRTAQYHIKCLNPIHSCPHTSPPVNLLMRPDMIDIVHLHIVFHGIDDNLRYLLNQPELQLHHELRRLLQRAANHWTPFSHPYLMNQESHDTIKTVSLALVKQSHIFLPVEIRFAIMSFLQRKPCIDQPVPSQLFLSRLREMRKTW